MDNIEKFFRVLKFLNDNPKLALSEDLNKESFYYDDAVKSFLESVKLNPFNSLSFPKDYNIIQTALQARTDSANYIENVIFPGSYAFNTEDMALLRKMLIDWAGATKTSSDLMIRSTNAFFLDDESIDKAIAGFGINFVTKKSLDYKTLRTFFLLSLCDLYKIKGSPESIRLSLQLANCPNAIIREWWFERHPTDLEDIRLRGVAVKRKQYFDSKLKQYVEYDTKYYNDVFLTSENFNSKLSDIGEPHWWYTNQEILNIDNNENTKMKLPSLTPYFGVEFYIDYQLFNILIGIVERIVSDQLNTIITGNINLVPHEIGVDGFNQEVSQKDLWLEGFTDPICLLEAFLGFSYCQIRYDEFKQYEHFKNFLISKGVILSGENYTYPWAFHELVYWCYKNKDVLVDDRIPIHNIVAMYKPGFTNYYCSTNELMKWWLNRPLDSGETEYHTKENVPDIFFNPPFNFFLKEQDTFFDRIFYYNGPRNIDFKSDLFDYKGIFSDFDNLLKKKLYRREFDDKYKSYHSANRKNEHLTTVSDLQTKFLNTYFNFISDPSPTYLDTEEHNGNKLTPIYTGKYPISKTENWAVDSIYMYSCISPNKWVRHPVVSDWDEGIKLPHDEPIDEFVFINNLIYSEGYLYKYISNNKWIRHSVATEWDLCEGSLDNEGFFKETSNLAKKIVKAKITPGDAKKYYNDELASKRFTLMVDPYFKKENRVVNLNQFKEFLRENQYILNETTGLIYPNFSYFYENNYLYQKYFKEVLEEIEIDGEFETVKKIKEIWVRFAVSSVWEQNSNGNKIYEGTYKFPNLCLIGRYDAERILKGRFAIKPDDTVEIEGISGDKILVCKGPNGYPQIYDFSHSETYLDNGIIKYNYIWVPSLVNDINNIDLGLNQKLLDWINNFAESEEDYESLADRFLTSVSIYIRTYFPDFDFDIASIYKKIKNAGVHKDLIDFFKPKRARLLYFSLVLDIEDNLNSIVLDEEISRTKLLYEIFDHVPRSDTVLIDKNYTSLNCYHNNDKSTYLLIPERTFDTGLVKSLYYIKGIKTSSNIQKINGFYFYRSDLEISYPYVYNTTSLDIPVSKHPYYLNDHNICLTKILNDKLINGHDRMWVIAPRKENIHFCDCYFVCFDNDFVNGTWYSAPDLTINEDIEIIKTEDLESIPEEEALNILLPEHRKDIIDFDNYELQKENHWNIVHTRNEPTNSYKSIEKTISNKIWETAFCKDIFNFRRIFPPGILGYPENVQGSRLDGYYADSRDPLKLQERKTLWSDYIYDDDQCLIRDAAKPVLLRDVVLGSQQISSSDVVGDHIPVWWSDAGFSPDRYRSGPIHHRPVFMGILQHIHDCYPCRPVSKCCDYYDTGCFHDGPTNPQISFFDGDDWGPTKYSNYELYDLSYDIFTKYHKKLNQFIADPVLQEYYDNEKNHVIQLDNPGDTYCNECSHPVFTPDLSFYNLPEDIKRNGIFHNKLNAVGFSNSLSWINGVWLSFKNDGQEPIELQSIGQLTDINNNLIEFKHGYVNEYGDEIVHIFDSNIGYHYWEVRKLLEEEMGSSSSSSSEPQFETILRSKLKKKVHTIDDIINWTLKDFIAHPGNFLNGNDIDVAEDEWCLPSIDISEDDQIVVNGKLSSSMWIRFDSLDVPEFNSKSGALGETEYDGSYLYYCTSSNHNTREYTWKKILADSTWLETEESWVRPIDGNNPYGYMFMDTNYDFRSITTNNYMYVYVDTDLHKGWVRHLVDIDSLTRSYTITSEFIMNGNTIHRLVFNPLKFKDDLNLPLEKYHKYIENSLDYKFVCGDPVPYNETFDGIWSLMKKPGGLIQDPCKCNIEERIFISGWGYDEDPTGPFIKVYVSDPPPVYQFIEKSYFSDEEYGFYSRFNTPPNYRGHMYDYFYYDTRFGSIPTGLTRVGDDYYERVSLDPSTWHTTPYCINTVEELVDTTIILVGTPGYDFTFSSNLSISPNGARNVNKYYITTYTSDTIGLPYDNDNVFYGTEKSNTIESNCYFKFLINGTHYYIPIYEGEHEPEMNTGIFGDRIYSGDFEIVGYSLIKVNDNLKYIPLYQPV